MVTRVAPQFHSFWPFQALRVLRRKGAEAAAGLGRFRGHAPLPGTLATQSPLGSAGGSGGYTADLMAAWQSVGFCHGVMNTDNMSILGLTIDYGLWVPGRFNPDHVCNHSDSQGRYSWNNQPQIGYWNLRAWPMPLVRH